MPGRAGADGRGASGDHRRHLAHERELLGLLGRQPLGDGGGRRRWCGGAGHERRGHGPLEGVPCRIGRSGRRRWRRRTGRSRGVGLGRRVTVGGGSGAVSARPIRAVGAAPVRLGCVRIDRRRIDGGRRVERHVVVVPGRRFVDVRAGGRRGRGGGLGVRGGGPPSPTEDGEDQAEDGPGDEEARQHDLPVDADRAALLALVGVEDVGGGIAALSAGLGGGLVRGVGGPPVDHRGLRLAGRGPVAFARGGGEGDGRRRAGGRGRPDARVLVGVFVLELVGQGHKNLVAGRGSLGP